MIPACVVHGEDAEVVVVAAAAVDSDWILLMDCWLSCDDDDCRLPKHCRDAADE